MVQAVQRRDLDVHVRVYQGLALKVRWKQRRQECDLDLNLGVGCEGKDTTGRRVLIGNLINKRSDLPGCAHPHQSFAINFDQTRPSNDLAPVQDYLLCQGHNGVEMTYS